MKLNESQLSSLKDSKISFSYLSHAPKWIDEGIVEMPAHGVYAEDYSSYFVSTHFHSVGAFSYSWSAFPRNVSIGRFTSIAERVEVLMGGHPTHLFSTSPMLYDPRLSFGEKYIEDHGSEDFSLMPWQQHHSNGQSLMIGNDVYICAGAKLRSGITIGDGSIVAAESVVTKSVPPYSLVAGNPATVKRMRYSQEQIGRLMALKWWEWDFKKILQLSKDAPIDVFMDRLEKEIATGRIEPFLPSRNFLSRLLSD